MKNSKNAVSGNQGNCYTAPSKFVHPGSDPSYSHKLQALEIVGIDITKYNEALSIVQKVDEALLRNKQTGNVKRAT